MADVITNGGRAQTAGYVSNTVSQVTQYYGNVGTGAGTAAVADTTLFTEVGSARIATTMSRVTTTVTDDTARNVFTYTATGGVNVTNAGVWTASSGGVLMQKSDHATIPLLAADSIQYTFDDKMA
jgi:ribosomal protein RSM22 (predicted rRNA methylase)